VAESATSLSVAPAVIEEAVEPAQNITRQITVGNNGEIAIPIRVSVDSLISREITPNSTLASSDASQWISLSNDSFILAPGENQVVNATFSIPQDASPGGNYAQITVRSLSLESSSGAADTIVIPEVSMAVLLTVAGNISESFRIVGIRALPLFASRNQRLTSTVEVENTGNVHNRIRAELVVRHASGTDRLPYDSAIVLPGSRHTLRLEWTTPNNYGLHSVHTEVFYGSVSSTISTPKRTLILTHPLPLLGLLAIAVWSGLYLFQHRTNLKKAAAVLLGIR
jgi:hypothetical protein